MPRDDFSAATIRALALRSHYFCSFRGCGAPTVGPSDESPTAVSNSGVAAHISAASPGGKRYMASMTSEERSHINNGIWLCAIHAKIIDDDETSFTVPILETMKKEHEELIRESHQEGVAPIGTIGDLFSIGPEIICVGEVVGGAERPLLMAQYLVRCNLSRIPVHFIQLMTIPVFSNCSLRLSYHDSIAFRKSLINWKDIAE